MGVIERDLFGEELEPLAFYASGGKKSRSVGRSARMWEKSSDRERGGRRKAYVYSESKSRKEVWRRKRKTVAPILILVLILLAPFSSPLTLHDLMPFLRIAEHAGWLVEFLNTLVKLVRHGRACSSTQLFSDVHVHTTSASSAVPTGIKAPFTMQRTERNSLAASGSPAGWQPRTLISISHRRRPSKQKGRERPAAAGSSTKEAIIKRGEIFDLNTLTRNSFSTVSAKPLRQTCISRMNTWPVIVLPIFSFSSSSSPMMFRIWIVPSA